MRKHTSLPTLSFMICHIVTKLQQRKTYVKLTWFDQHFSEHEVIVEIGSPNSIHAFNRFQEEGHVKSRYNHLRLIDLTREEFYAMVVPAILDDEEEQKS